MEEVHHTGSEGMQVLPNTFNNNISAKILLKSYLQLNYTAYSTKELSIKSCVSASIYHQKSYSYLSKLVQKQERQ